MKSHQKGLIGLALTALLAPFFLRRRMRVFRRAFIAAPPALVFSYLNNLRNWPLWRDWNRRTESPHFSYAGPPTGVGATQIFETSSGDGVLRIVVSEPPDHLAYTIDMGGEPSRIEGVFALREAKRGTHVRWVLKWDGKKSPPMRYADLWCMICRGRQMGAELAELQRLAESVLREGSGSGGMRVR